MGIFVLSKQMHGKAKRVCQIGWNVVHYQARMQKGVSVDEWLLIMLSMEDVNRCLSHNLSWQEVSL
jgi:hypothetical protein